jgi:hypothetical protein
MPSSSSYCCPVELALLRRREDAEAALLASAPSDNDADEVEAFCARAAVSVAAGEGEAFVGGMDSDTLLHLMAGQAKPTEGTRSSVDLMVSLYAPGDDDDNANNGGGGGGAPELLLDARGPAALELVRRYWRARPESPLVVRRGEVFAPARLQSVDEEDLGDGDSGDGRPSPPLGPMSLAHARSLAEAGARNLRLHVPEKSDG